MIQKRLLSVKQACDYLGISRMTLLDAETKGLLEPERTVGGHRRYTRDALEAFLQRTRSAYEELQFISPAESGFLLPRFISQLTASPTFSGESLNEALRNLVVLLQAEIGATFTMSEDGRLRLRASFGIPRWTIKDLQILPEQGISTEAVHRRQPLVYPVAESEMPLRLETGQGICAPLIYHDQVLGVVHVISSHRYQFFPSEINICATIAVYLASLLVNSQLLEQQQTLLKELSLLNRVGSAMENQTELDPVLHTFLSETIATMNADAGAVWLRQRPGNRLYVRAAKGYPEAIFEITMETGEGIVGWVVEHGQPHFSPCMGDDPLFLSRARFLAGKIISNICFPLRSDGETIGAFNISTHSPRTFAPDEIRFLSTIGNQAAVIIRRAILLEEAERQAEAEHHARDYYQVVVENLEVGMAVVDAAMRLVLWNRAMEGMTGIRSDEAIGRNPYEVLPAMEKGWSAAERTLRTGQSGSAGPFVHPVPLRGTGVCEARMTPLLDGAGKLSAIILYVHPSRGE